MSRGWGLGRCSSPIPSQQVAPHSDQDPQIPDMQGWAPLFSSAHQAGSQSVERARTPRKGQANVGELILPTRGQRLQAQGAGSGLPFRTTVTGSRPVISGLERDSPHTAVSGRCQPHTQRSENAESLPALGGRVDSHLDQTKVFQLQNFPGEEISSAIFHLQCPFHLHTPADGELTTSSILLEVSPPSRSLVSLSQLFLSPPPPLPPRTLGAPETLIPKPLPTRTPGVSLNQGLHPGLLCTFLSH